MTPHERILDIADFAEGDPRRDGLVALGKADAAALRELDQLLSDMADCIKYDCERNNNGPVNKKLRAIELRLAQAGYGEK